MIYNFQIFCQLPATVSVLWVNVSGQWPYRAFVYLWFLQVKRSGGKTVVSVILIFFWATKWTWQFSVSATISADIKPMNMWHFVFLAFLIFKKQKKKFNFVISGICWNWVGVNTGKRPWNRWQGTLISGPNPSRSTFSR